MSVKVMDRVWDSDLSPNHKLVLLAYADGAEHDGTQSYPGWERLVTMTGYSRSQIDRITKELVDLGVLRQTKKGRKGQRAEFEVVMAKVSQSAPQQAVDSVASEPDSDASMRHLPSSTPVHTSPNGDGLFESFFEFWTGKPYGKGQFMPKSMRGRLNAAVKEARLAQITADEVEARGRKYTETWCEMERTPQALLTNWHRFEPDQPVPECVACGNRGLVALDPFGHPTDWDDPESSVNAPCPECSAVRGGEE